eukprot:jgi/Botrbrau1/22668/Bobra.0132s0014.1
MKAAARASYRALQRAIQSHITLIDGNKLWQHFVANQFRKSVKEGNQDRASRLIQLSKDCAYLINSVHEQRALLLSYNIGIDRDVRQRQMIRSTAALVGFKLPDLGSEEVNEEDQPQK